MFFLTNFIFLSNTHNNFNSKGSSFAKILKVIQTPRISLRTLVLSKFYKISEIPRGWHCGTVGQETASNTDILRQSASSILSCCFSNPASSYYTGISSRRQPNDGDPLPHMWEMGWSSWLLALAGPRSAVGVIWGVNRWLDLYLHQSSNK